ncbi:MAG: hypothetical protein DHS20C01_36040 [marine bacterium B5-7]|nr:MAG: hypothetical protein DHS20C01_36040 [marine bacterium B5-7]
MNLQQMGSDLKARWQANPDSFPNIGIFVVAYNAANRLTDTLERIPDDIYELISEVFVYDDASADDTYALAEKYVVDSRWAHKLRIYANPVNLGYGGNQKVGFNYAIEKKLDCVVLLHGDGQYAPEYLPAILHPFVFDDQQVVFGSRMFDKRSALRGGMPMYKWVGNQILTTIQNFVLGMKLTEFHSGYRLYSTDVLKRVNFESNSNGFDFDSQIIIQCRALGAEIHEVPIPTYYGDELCHVDGVKYAFEVLQATFLYRLHQLHIVRSPVYIVDADRNYSRKRSAYGSHEQILSLVPVGNYQVLDVGSGSGLLAADLVEKGAVVTAVDIEFDAQTRRKDVSYIEIDLDTPNQPDFGRRYDYVIAADLIEHLRHADPFVRNLHRSLKSDGKLILSTPNIAIWFYRLSLLIGRFNYGDKGTLDRTHVHLYTLDTIRFLLEKNGFFIEEVHTTSLPFEVVFESVRQSLPIRMLDSTYYALTRIWKRMFAYQFVLVASITRYEAAGKNEGILVSPDKYSN